jgi:hypothetical protein
MPKALAALAGQDLGSLEDDEVMPIKRVIPSRRSWHTSMRRCSNWSMMNCFYCP